MTKVIFVWRLFWGRTHFRLTQVFGRVSSMWSQDWGPSPPCWLLEGRLFSALQRPHILCCGTSSSSVLQQLSLFTSWITPMLLSSAVSLILWLSYSTFKGHLITLGPIRLSPKLPIFKAYYSILYAKSLCQGKKEIRFQELSAKAEGVWMRSKR